MTFVLTQQEADALFALDKHCDGGQHFDFPSFGGALRIPLYSSDRREEFSLDITRSRIELKKSSFNTRARKAVVLARVDIGGPPHRNPDGEEIACPHLHLYREGWADKWAMPLPDLFGNALDARSVLSVFMGYCKIVTRPVIEQGLFT